VSDQPARCSVRAALQFVDVIDAHRRHLDTRCHELRKQGRVVEGTLSGLSRFVSLLKDHEPRVVLATPDAVRPDRGAERTLEDAVVLDLPSVVVSDTVVDHDGCHRMPPDASVGGDSSPAADVAPGVGR